MEEIIARLEISKGSASQGLRQLEELGAVSRARENGERSHIYIARIELKPLLAGFLDKRLAPRLASGAGRLKHLEKLLPRCLRIFARPLAFACKESQSGTNVRTPSVASGAKAVTGRLNPLRPCGKTTTYHSASGLPEWSDQGR